jgi:hypothetical protein
MTAFTKWSRYIYKNGGTFYRRQSKSRPSLAYLRSSEQLGIYHGGCLMDYSRMAKKLRAKIEKFSGEFSDGLPKPTRRLVMEMAYGIQASKSVVLTKVGRTLEAHYSSIKGDGFKTLTKGSGYGSI